MNALSSCDAANIGGLIDGEGTITLSGEHRNENRRLVVSIASTERCLVEFVLGSLGDHVYSNCPKFNSLKEY